MPIRYESYQPNHLAGMAWLDNFQRTRRTLAYKGCDDTTRRVIRGMPLHEVTLTEPVGSRPDESGNMLIHGECIATCAYLKSRNVKVDLVYIDPPFASGANYAKKIRLRSAALQNVQIEGEAEPDMEEQMYSDIWTKESYLNWMYENLMAIKTVMSETATIYVHLDWHIGHYVKILLDEVFGEQNFKNEVVWYYYNKMPDKRKPIFTRSHDVIYVYSKSSANDSLFHLLTEKRDTAIKQLVRKKVGKKMINARDEDGNVLYRETDERIIDDVWRIPMLQPADTVEPVDYATQKPEALLERIIRASSDEGMVVADFFGGSGTTAVVAQRLGRHFITCDINTNSIQTTRDRLVAAGASFQRMMVRDGVSLFRNPVQTQERLPAMIGMFQDATLPSVWSGCIINSRGKQPVYLPSLTQYERVLDPTTMSTLIFDGMMDLPEDVRNVIIYYVDVEDWDAINDLIGRRPDPRISVELRDLKQLLDEYVFEDDADFSSPAQVPMAGKPMFHVWQVTLHSFHSDRVCRMLDAFNQKRYAQALKRAEREGSALQYSPITMSESQLEAIEWVSLDCTEAAPSAPWHSDAEVKIEPDCTVRIGGGEKNRMLWDGIIQTLDDRCPLRMRIRNICGDETTYIFNP